MFARSAPVIPGVARAMTLEIDVLVERDLARVDLQNALASPDVGHVDHDTAVESARAEKRRIENVGSVGRGEKDDALVALEPVHLDEELVQRLLALVVTAAETRAPVAPDGVDLVDEENARRVLLALVEEVPHAGGPHADEHLDEIRSAHREERHVGLAGHRLGEKRFPRPRRPEQEGPLRDPAAKSLKFLGIAEKLDDLLELLLRLVGPGDVVERHARAVPAEHPRPALAEAEGLVPAGLHLAHDEEPEPHDEEQGKTRGEQFDPNAPAGDLALDDRVLVLGEDPLGESVVLHGKDEREVLDLDLSLPVGVA